MGQRESARMALPFCRAALRLHRPTIPGRRCFCTGLRYHGPLYILLCHANTKSHSVQDRGRVPFTRSTLLLCQVFCGERAKRARRRPLCTLGSRQQKSPLRGTSDSDVWLSGSARLVITRLIPEPRPSGANAAHCSKSFRTILSMPRFASARIPAGCPGQTSESEAIFSRRLNPQST